MCQVNSSLTTDYADFADYLPRIDTNWDEDTEKEKDIRVSGKQEVGIRGPGEQEGESRASSTRAKNWCEVSHPTRLNRARVSLSVQVCCDTAFRPIQRKLLE